jgi:hypothetical protein
MSQQLNLTAPQEGDASKGYSPTGQWRVAGLYLQRGWSVNGTVITADPANSHIYIRLIGEYGRVREHNYDGAQADALILALNKANLTNNSLEARILAQLVADGKEAGAIAGQPD